MYPLRRGILFLVSLILAAPAFAQAPAVERAQRDDALLTAQRRITALLREVDAADSRLKRAEQDLKRSEQEVREAAARLDEARRRSESAAKALKEAQQQSAQAHKAYEAESDAFDKLRRTPAAEKK